jgi:hypothetical protein
LLPIFLNVIEYIGSQKCAEPSLPTLYDISVVAEKLPQLPVKVPQSLVTAILR